VGEDLRQRPGPADVLQAGRCDKCGGSGLKGRCGLHELLIASDRLKKAIQEHARVAEMLAIAVEEGMRTLKQDGMEKCLAGITHIKEVRSVCIKWSSSLDTTAHSGIPPGRRRGGRRSRTSCCAWSS